MLRPIVDFPDPDSPAIPIVLFAFIKADSSILVLKPHNDIDPVYLEDNDVSTIMTLFVDGLSLYHNGEIKFSQITCNDDECALEQLLETGNDEVIYGKLQKLGSKIIFSASILDIDKSFSSKATAMSVEDMEQVCLRLSKSIALRQTLEESADIDNITEKDEQESARRKSLGRTGISIGYLFPFEDLIYVDYNNSMFGEDSEQVSEEYSNLLKFSWNYYYEFKNNTALLLECGMGIPFMGLDISFLKFTNIIDTSPFYGLGIGLYDSYDSNNRTYNSGHTTQTQESSSGIGLSLQSGVMLYRTYNINVIARAKYLVVTNSDLDNGLIVDIKFQKNMPEKKNRTVYRYPILEMILGR